MFINILATLAKSVQHRSDWAKRGQCRPNPQSAGQIRETRPKFGLTWSMWADFGQMLADASRLHPKFGPNWPMLPEFAQSVHAFGQHRATLGQSLPMLGGIDQMLTASGQQLEFRQCWAELGQLLDDLGQAEPEFGPNWPMLIKTIQCLAQIGPASAPGATFRQLLDKCWAAFEQLRSSRESPGVSLRGARRAFVRQCLGIFFLSAFIGRSRAAAITTSEAALVLPATHLATAWMSTPASSGQMLPVASCPNPEAFDS